MFILSIGHWQSCTFNKNMIFMKILKTMSKNGLTHQIMVKEEEKTITCKKNKVTGKIVTKIASSET